VELIRQDRRNAPISRRRGGGTAIFRGRWLASTWCRRMPSAMPVGWLATTSAGTMGGDMVAPHHGLIARDMGVRCGRQGLRRPMLQPIPRIICFMLVLPNVPEGRSARPHQREVSRVIASPMVREPVAQSLAIAHPDRVCVPRSQAPVWPYENPLPWAGQKPCAALHAVCARVPVFGSTKAECVGTRASGSRETARPIQNGWSYGPRSRQPNIAVQPDPLIRGALRTSTSHPLFLVLWARQAVQKFTVWR
jgi:hypothetical protein